MNHTNEGGYCEKCIIPSHGYQQWHKKDCDCSCHTTPPQSSNTAVEEVEKLSVEIHQLYCAQYLKDHGKPYWTEGDYSKLEERVKEYDRNIARWHLSRLTKLVEEARADTAKAFGGCTLCYGKGYATQRETAGGGKRVWVLSPYRPCSCDRGKQFTEALQWAKADMKAKCLEVVPDKESIDFSYRDFETYMANGRNNYREETIAATQAIPISNETLPEQEKKGSISSNE